MNTVDSEDILSAFDALVKRSRQQTCNSKNIESVVYAGDKVILVEDDICIDDFKAMLLADSTLLSSDISYDNRSGSTSSNIDVGPADDDDDDDDGFSNRCRDRLRATAWKRCLNVDTCSSKEGSDAYLSLTKVFLRGSLYSEVFPCFTIIVIVSRRPRHTMPRSRMTLSAPSKGMISSGIKLRTKGLSFEC